MKVLIVEDETSSFENLKAILQEVDPTIEVLANTESVAATTTWLQTHAQPSLIFMDIHLSDDSAFEIFNRMTVEVPIVFTTAYDQYAIDAFRVNSIDYLLKPIKTDDVRRALDKFRRLTRTEVSSYVEQMARLATGAVSRRRILIPVRDKLLPVVIDEISFVYTTGKQTEIHMEDGNVIPVSKTLDQMMQIIDRHDFYRANKQFLVHRENVRDITIWFDSRLLVSMDVATPESLFVSKNRAAEFKEWMTRE